jgi:hypothetical protein
VRAGAVPAVVGATADSWVAVDHIRANAMTRPIIKNAIRISIAATLYYGSHGNPTKIWISKIWISKIWISKIWIVKNLDCQNLDSPDRRGPSSFIFR